jgi:glutaconate CoA-transferase, subunit B
VIVRHSRRTFVEKADFITSVGYGSGLDDRKNLGLPGRGPQKIITDLGVLTPDPATREFIVTGIYPGVSAETITDRTGWDVAIAAEPEIVAPPTSGELAALRKFKAMSPSA